MSVTQQMGVSRHPHLEEGRAMPISVTLVLTARDDLSERLFPGNFIAAMLQKPEMGFALPPELFTGSSLPFAVSPFMPSQNLSTCPEKSCKQTGGIKAIQKGDRFRLRLCWLDDTHMELLLNRFSSFRDLSLLSESPCGAVSIERALLSPTPADPWSRTASYGKILDQASDSCRKVMLKFYSPCALYIQGRPYPLPDPFEIFLGYLSQWNRFAGPPLDPELEQACQRGLCLVDFRLRMRLFRDEKDTMPGFVGSAVFSLQGRHPESVLKGLNALWDYAYFCGTGISTARGMGMTRRILQGEQGD